MRKLLIIKKIRPMLSVVLGLVLISVTTVSVEAASSNNTCSSARSVSFSGNSYTNSVDSRSNSNNHRWYGSSPRYKRTGGSDAFWKIPSASQVREYSINTNGSTEDMILHVYRSCTDVSNRSNSVARNDNSGSGSNAALTFTSQTGQAYYVVVDRKRNSNRNNYGARTAKVNISYEEQTPAQPSANDRCADATTVNFSGNSYTDSVDTSDNRNDHTDYGSGDANVGGSDAFWRIPAVSGTREYTIDTNGSSYDTVLHVYRSCSNMTSHSNRVARDNNSGSDGSDSTLTFTASSGQEYIVVVDRYRSGNSHNYGGNTNIRITYSAPSANDRCASATTVSFTDARYTDSVNTEDNHNDHTDYGSGVRNVGGSDAFWRIPAVSQSRLYRINTNGSNYNTVLHVYRSCSNMSSHSNYVARDDNSGSGEDSSLSFTASAGQEYIVVVDRYRSGNSDNYGGDTDLEITYSQPSANNRCSDATTVSFSGNSYTNSVNTSDNHNDHTDYGSGAANVGGSDAFWTIPAVSGARTYTVDTNGSGYDTILHIYRTCSNMSSHASRVMRDDDSGTDSTDSSLTFEAEANQSYLVVVDRLRNGDSDNYGGSTTLNIEYTASGSGDDSGDEDDGIGGGVGSGTHRSLYEFGALADGRINVSHGSDPRRSTTYEGNIQVWYNDGISRPGGGSPAIPRIQVYWPTQDSNIDERGGDSGFALRLSNGNQWGVWGEASGIRSTLGNYRIQTRGSGTTGQERDGDTITSRFKGGPGNLIYIDQMTTYTLGNSHFDIKWKIYTLGPQYTGVKFFHDVDTFTSGNDFGYGYRCSITKIVGGTGGRRFFQGLIALTPSDIQSEDNWYDLHIRVRNGGITSGTVSYQDNGMGHQWNNLTINAVPIYLAQRWTFDDPIRLSSYGTPVSILVIADEDYETLYNVKFEKDDWKGEIEALNLPFDDTEAPKWEAGDMLASRLFSDRTIYTNTEIGLVEFNAANTGLSTTLVDYVKGDDSNELSSNSDLTVDITTTTSYRNRGGWKLGDIAHSNPVYVPSKPNLPFTAHSYESWADSISRDATIYVGGNDGMLHAFDAGTGVEKWAFVPDVMWSRLSELTKTYYEQLRLPMVDLSPIYFDVYIGGSWKTILLVGLREGGESYYCLDITDPDNPSFLWEFGDSEMGNSWSKPSVARLNTGTETWAAIFGSGYDTHAAQQATQTAYIYVVDLSNGTIIKKSQLSTTKNNVVSGTVSVDVDNNGYVDRAYFGDLTGKLWRLDLSSTNTGNWSHSLLFQAGSEQTITESGYGYGNQEYTYTYWTQPISMTPLITLTDDEMTTSANRDKPIVIFGTGKFDSFYDNYSTDTQYVYGIIDRDGSTEVTTSDLYTQTVTTTTLSGEDVRTVTDDDITSKRGWRVPLASSGERMVNDGELFSDILYVTSMIPDSTQFCEATGEGWLYVLDYETGGSTDEVMIDVNEDEEFDDSDRVGGSGGRAVAGKKYTGGIISSPIMDLKRNRAIVKIGQDIETTGVKLPSGVVSSDLIYWREVF